MQLLVFCIWPVRLGVFRGNDRGEPVDGRLGHRRLRPNRRSVQAYGALGENHEYVVANICFERHNSSMNWIVELADEFEPEFDALDTEVLTEVLALSRLLQRFGPQLGRPRGGHSEWLAVREYEGVEVQRRKRGVAPRLRIRPGTQGCAARCRR